MVYESKIIQKISHSRRIHRFFDSTLTMNEATFNLAFAFLLLSLSLTKNKARKPIKRLVTWSKTTRKDGALDHHKHWIICVQKLRFIAQNFGRLFPSDNPSFQQRWRADLKSMVFAHPPWRQRMNRTWYWRNISNPQGVSKMESIPGDRPAFSVACQYSTCHPL